MVTFNPTASTVLKWLRFKFMSYENEMKWRYIWLRKVGSELNPWMPPVQFLTDILIYDNWYQAGYLKAVTGISEVPPPPINLGQVKLQLPVLFGSLKTSPEAWVYSCWQL
jgi:hypothetical protein